MSSGWCAGHVEDMGVGDGRHYSVNVPLQEGMDDDSYRFMFEPIMQKVSLSQQCLLYSVYANYWYVD